MPPRTLIPVYGGKSQLAAYYPSPKFPVIVEPFAGGANYSLRYASRTVVLIDSNPQLVAAWRWLIHTDVDTVLRSIPRRVSAGDRVSDMSNGGPVGLREYLRAHCNLGTFGRQNSDVVTHAALGRWHLAYDRAEYWCPQIKHWTVHNGQYSDFGGFTATWFIDPPYNNAAGLRYQHQFRDYPGLSKWCLERRGQIIVCENSGADWLPFRFFRKQHQGLHVRTKQDEVIWTKG